jgi:hypothetical protein
LRQNNFACRKLEVGLISIDNAVELMIKTNLGQPARALGIHIPRRRLDEISESFPALIDALEEFAKDRLGTIDLSDIEWFHRVRNQLYHGGNGLTVEKQKVVVYAELAEELFNNLFQLPPSEQAQPDTAAVFLQKMSELQQIGDKLAEQDGITHGMGYQLSYLALNKRFPGYEAVRSFRNNLVHSASRQSEPELRQHLAKVEELIKAASDELAKGA